VEQEAKSIGMADASDGEPIELDEILRLRARRSAAAFAAAVVVEKAKTRRRTFLDQNVRRH